MSGQFTKVRKLGEGGFGSVQLISHSKWGEVACKKINSRTVSSVGTEILKEARIQQGLRHPNIVTLYDFLFEPPRYLLFLEYMKYGSVDEFLKDYVTSWQWKTQITYEVVLGMSYLHEQNPKIIHGDLSCGNILIGQEYHAKVSDFGLAHMKEISKSRTDNRNAGTITYMAPEYLTDSHRKKKESYDVYGFGICVWEIFSEKTAYYDCTNIRALHIYVEKGERPNLKDIDEEVPGFVSKLITKCWDGEIEKRPTFDAIKTNLAGQIRSFQNKLEQPVKRVIRLSEQSSSFDRTSSGYQTANRQSSSSGNSSNSGNIEQKKRSVNVTGTNSSGPIHSNQKTTGQPVKRKVQQEQKSSSTGSSVHTINRQYNLSDIQLTNKIEVPNDKTFGFSGRINKVMGLAFLGNKIYVAQANSFKIIAISSEEPFDRVREEDINVMKLVDKANYKTNVMKANYYHYADDYNSDDSDSGSGIDPFDFMLASILDVAACSACQSVFICRNYYSKNTVWKIKFPNKSVSKLFEGESNKSESNDLLEEQVLRLSTNPSGELVVLVNQRGRWCVLIYCSSDGQQLRRIVIQETNIEPRHAIITRQGNVFMSYSVKAANAMFVGEITLKGEIFRKFDFDSIEPIQIVELSPTHDMFARIVPTKTYDSYLAFDGNNGIFIADTFNDRIFLLDPQSMECQVIIQPSSSKDKRLSRHQLDSPTRLCYSVEKQYLMIGQHKTPAISLTHPTLTFPSVSMSIFDLGNRNADRQTQLTKRSRTATEYHAFPWN